MEIFCVNHDGKRDITQLAWAVFGNLDGKIISTKIEDRIETRIFFAGEEFVENSDYHEKNDAKRSLYRCAKKIRDFDTPWGILTGINPAKLAQNNYCKEDFMQKYLVSSKRADLCKEVWDFTKSVDVCTEDLSIYISIPFCKSKCKYCSFVSNSIDTANKYMKKYVECLICELETVAKLIKNRKLRTIYIGGGTPTALDLDDFSKLLACVSKNFSFENLQEFTVEAGRVDTITQEKLSVMKKENVTRISINPQVFDDEILTKIGRKHTCQDVYDIYEKAQKMNFDAINMDIIYGLGGDFSKTVDEVLRLFPENVTMHTLAIKKGSMIDKTYTEDFGDINYFYDRIFDHYKPYYMYKQQYMIKPYENVGFSRDGKECLYNVYMMENLMDILAVGSGSTSKISGESLFNNKYPLDYINNIEEIVKKKILILKKG
ncbi:MAG: coproporphyrinogen dehydrogenase HemZ [Clostridia bacterium]